MTYSFVGYPLRSTLYSRARIGDEDKGKGTGESGEKAVTQDTRRIPSTRVYHPPPLPAPSKLNPPPNEEDEEAEDSSTALI